MAFRSRRFGGLKRDPEKWEPVFGSDHAHEKRHNLEEQEGKSCWQAIRAY
ncbi:hypothetical protein CEV33_1923 [Brucella grignonensis]|uniref:Uncharacterized protein n=1 Tax=Brucella grignonensis TaxID=94627 RepID=A0A256F6I5_9HYPH|nr:hypothetical protein CEV33_1923 [Brucella grignonensis]